ncbi:gamma-glutamyltransferase [Herbiconiux sp.]|uniref:gamma-glutamyltransferase n=1 Tax=Herbiconiux sp. TaxID=1871186 RepID=UPI0025BFB226|nr:gamma-glutamyltransferase [Herbiconiux sp.]
MTESSAALSVGIAAPHEAAVRAGEEAVAAGGNAIDAALAAAGVLAVVYPHQCGLGGDLVALVRGPDGDTTAIVSVGAAAKRVDVERLAELGAMPRQGGDTVTVPGAVAGWTAAWHLGARLPLAGVFDRAARLARDGFPVSPGLARAIEVRAEGIAADPGLATVFMPDGRLLGSGDILVQERLAETLDVLAVDPDEMYTGRIAESLAAGLEERGSALRVDDFSAHRAETGSAITRSIGTARWWVAPPPTQGVVLLGILPTALESNVSVDGDAALLDVVLDAAVARQDNLGDPRTGPIDVERMLDPRAKPPLEPAPPGGRALGDTVAIVAADSEGRVVSIIQSVYQLFGSGILEPRTGIVLQNRGSAFSVDPRHPGRIAPGSRPPHTLLPVIAETDGLRYGLGCQGGSAQPWILAQVAADLLSSFTDPLEVLARPRWVIGARDIGHAELTLLAEPGCTVAVRAAGERGVPVDLRDGPLDEAGHVQVVRQYVDARGREQMDAASDPRADGTARIVTPPPKEKS